MISIDADFKQLQDSNDNWKRYSISKYINRGSFGEVYEVFDNKTQCTVAIKVIFIKQWESGERPEYWNYMYRELCILKHVNSRYLLKLIDVQKTVREEKIAKLFLVMPFMEYDIHKILYIQKKFFSFDAIIKITCQILKGLKYLHESGIIHRDLKPSNIGINQNYEIRLLDFGLSRDQVSQMSMNISTVWYRAIEIFLTTHYSTSVDIWSMGCILAELLTRKPLFPGKTCPLQVKTVLEITGLPANYECSELEVYINKVPEGRHLREYIENDILSFGCINDDNANNPNVNARNAIDLICRMLEVDPSRRPKALDALQSELFQQNSALIKEFPDDEPAERFVFNSSQFTNEEIQERITQEINSYIEKE